MTVQIEFDLGYSRRAAGKYFSAAVVDGDFNGQVNDDRSFITALLGCCGNFVLQQLGSTEVEFDFVFFRRTGWRVLWCSSCSWRLQ